MRDVIIGDIVTSAEPSDGRHGIDIDVVGLPDEDREFVCAGIPADPGSLLPAAEPVASATSFGCALVHLPLTRGVQQRRALGHTATGEPCIHSLGLDQDLHGPVPGAPLKVNSPTRPGGRNRLRSEIPAKRVGRGSSDHANWPIGRKATTASMFDAGTGVPDRETLPPARRTKAKRHGLDAPRLVTQQPARFVEIGNRKSFFEIGSDSDNELNWSPVGRDAFSGLVTRTVVRGAVAWNRRAILNTPGEGAHLQHDGAG